MFKSLRLSAKISGGFGLVLVALLIVGAVGFTRITGVQTVVADLTETHIPLLQVISEIDVSATEQELAVTQYALHKDTEFYDKFDEFDTLVDAKFAEIQLLIKADQELVDEGWLEPIEKMAIQHDVFVTVCKNLIAAVNSGKSFDEWDAIADEVATQSAELMIHIDAFLEMNTDESNRIATLASNISGSARKLIGIISLSALGAGILISFLVVRGITKPINSTIENLKVGADQISSASGQVSSASQSLAEGASEQAAAIEETSASMEEMTATTRQNADNASNADNLMRDALNIMATAENSMDEMSASMEEISVASEETSKIVQTIDEIAFQTNLLALNAAVEAARAGEAGAGFAVVADEVRNLAMRAAAAAKNTAELIEGTVTKVNSGKEIVVKTNIAFKEVAKSSTKIGSLVEEISISSKEQSTGLNQINQAIIQMDAVTQQNSASAEESAAASEELNAQALSMMDIVSGLRLLVEGASRSSSAERSPAAEQEAFRSAPKTVSVPFLR